MRIIIQNYPKFVEIANERKTTTRLLGKQIIEEWVSNKGKDKIVKKSSKNTEKPKRKKKF